MMLADSHPFFCDRESKVIIIHGKTVQHRECRVVVEHLNPRSRSNSLFNERQMDGMDNGMIVFLNKNVKIHKDIVLKGHHKWETRGKADNPRPVFFQIVILVRMMQKCKLR